MIGQTVSHYRILERLGEGGMGVVYKALDTHLDRPVALKFLPPHLGTDKDARARFIQEAKSASALDHTNVCTVHDIDETDDGRLFIAMSCYEGESLKDKIARGPLPIEEAIDYAIQIAQGLEKAHKSGIIHRDIKPGNVIVTDEGVVKIVDFGLAKMAETSLTKTGKTLGTAMYMSPEQARGEDVDHRTDIWSMGVVFYEMVTGFTPFKGEYELAVIYSILHNDCAPITDYRDDVPSYIQTIIRKSLEKDASVRYQQVSDFVDDLQTKLETPVETKKIQIKNVASRPVTIFTLVLLLSFLLIWIARQTVVRPTQPVQSPIALAVFPFQDQNPNPLRPDYAGVIQSELVTMLSQLGPLIIREPDSDYMIQDSTMTPHIVAQELKADFYLEGNFEWSETSILLSTRIRDVSEGKTIWNNDWHFDYNDIIGLQSEIARMIVRSLDLELTRVDESRLTRKGTNDIRAYDFYLRGLDLLHKTTREGNELAITFFEQALESDSTFTDAYARIGQAYKQKIDFVWYDNEEDEKSYFDAWHAVALKAVALDDNIELAHITLGDYYLYRDEYEKAREEMFRVYELNPHSIQGLIAMVSIYLTNNQYEEALNHVDEILVQRPYATSYQWIRGRILTYLQRYEEAIGAFQVVIYSGNAPGYYYRETAEVLSRGLRQHSEAEDWYRAALARTEKDNHDGLHVDIGINALLNNEVDKALMEYLGVRSTSLDEYPLVLLLTHSSLVHFADGLSLVQRVLETRRNNPGVWYALGIAYERNNQHRLAAASFDSLNIYARKLLLEDEENVEAHFYLGFSLARTGYEQEALQHADAGLQHTKETFDLAYYNKAITYSLVGGYPQQAVEMLEEAIRLRPALVDRARYDLRFVSLKDYPPFLTLINTQNQPVR